MNEIQLRVLADVKIKYFLRFKAGKV